MTYKTLYLPCTGRSPTKFAEQLERQLTELGSRGYEAIAITPINHNDGSTTGVVITARTSAK